MDTTTSNSDTTAAIKKAVLEQKVATFDFNVQKFTYEKVYSAFLSDQINMDDVVCKITSDETVKDMLRKKPVYK